jgi:hypothetical protein
MSIVEDALSKIQEEIESRLRERGRHSYGDPEYYDPEKTANVAMAYIQIDGKAGLAFQRKKMIQVHSDLESVRNKADAVESITWDLS